MTTYLLDASPYNSEGRPFGIARYAYHLSRALHGLRHELDPDEKLLVAVRIGDDAIKGDLRLEHHTDPVPEPYTSYNRRRKKLWPGTLARSEADLVHFVEGPQALKLPGKATVVTCQDLIPLIMPHQYLRGLYQQARRRWNDYLNYAGARRVTATSQTTADLLVNFMNLPRERVSVVMLGVDHQRFVPQPAPGERDEIAAKYRLPARYSLYVGATDWRKRVEMLIDCQAAVYRATGVPLALVGAEFDRPRPGVKDALARAVPESVIVVGEVPGEHLPALYRHSDLHVLPSVYEGFGLTVLEAMASGCPVITTKGGALHEVAGEAACYVAPDSASDLEAAMVDVLSDPAARDRLRERGIEHASRFTWERTARQTLAVWRKASGRRAPKAKVASNGHAAQAVAPARAMAPEPPRDGQPPR